MRHHEVFSGGVLRQRWDDDTHTYYEYDEQGGETSSRPYTDEENAAAAAADAAESEQVNESTLKQQASQAWSSNKDYLALATPTNAQVAAQVKALTRQMNGVIRLVTRRLDGTD